MQSGKKAVWLIQKFLKNPKFIVTNKKEVKLDEMFKSMQKVKGLSVMATFDTNK